MDARTPPVTVSETAAKRIAFLMGKENKPNSALRVLVKGGGCSGFQYGFAIDDKIAKDDEVIEQHGARLVIDPLSLMYLAGSQIDYVEKLIGAAFAVGNPNATSSCSCGSSFSV